jgi:hypothetical protein
LPGSLLFPWHVGYAVGQEAPHPFPRSCKSAAAAPETTNVLFSSDERRLCRFGAWIPRSLTLQQASRPLVCERPRLFSLEIAKCLLRHHEMSLFPTSSLLRYVDESWLTNVPQRHLGSRRWVRGFGASSASVPTSLSGQA